MIRNSIRNKKNFHQNKSKSKSFFENNEYKTVLNSGCKKIKTKSNINEKDYYSNNDFEQKQSFSKEVYSIPKIEKELSDKKDVLFISPIKEKMNSYWYNVVKKFFQPVSDQKKQIDLELLKYKSSLSSKNTSFKMIGIDYFLKNELY